MGSAQHQCAIAIDGAAGHPRPCGFIHRIRLSGDHAFINIGLARYHIAVHRDPFTGPGVDQVTGDNLVQWQFHHHAAPFHPRHLWGQPHQPADRGTGAPLGPRLQRAAQQDQHHDHGRRLEIHRSGAAGQKSGRKGGYHRIAVSRRCSQCHKAVHVGGSPQQGRVALAVKAVARPDQHNRGQDELQHPAGLHPDSPGNQMMQRRIEMRTHFHHEHRQRQGCGDPGHPRQPGRFTVLAGGQILGLVAGKRGGIACSGAGGDQIGGGNLPGERMHRGRFRCQIDPRCDHAGHGRQCPFHPRHTRGTSHVGNLQGHLGGARRISRLVQHPRQLHWAGAAIGGDAGGLIGQIDRCRRNTRCRQQRPFHPANARGAGHAFKRQGDNRHGHRGLRCKVPGIDRGSHYWKVKAGGANTFPLDLPALETPTSIPQTGEIM